MEWMSWTKSVFWDNGIISRGLKASVKYSYGTMSHLFEQMGVLPRVFSSMLTDRRAREITTNMIYIASHDVLPMLLVNAANGYIQRALSPENPEEAEWISMAFLTSSTLALLQLGVSAYNLRQGLQMTTRTIMVSLRASDAFNQIQPRPTSSLCIENKCSSTQRIQGGVRELVELTANDVAVNLIRKIPWMSGVATVLSIYARGRYIVKSTTPERCPDHRAIESEYALALGVNHEMIMMLLRKTLASTLGLSPSLCVTTMERMLFIFQIAVAAHMQPPLVKPGQGTLYVDPMDLYERLIGWLTTVVFSGLTEHIPLLFKGPKIDFPWQKCADMTLRFAYHPITARAKTILLPPLLRSDQAFIKDSVVSVFWPSLQNRMMTGLNMILSVDGSRLTVRVAGWAPNTAALFVKLFLGIPQAVTKGAITIIGNEQARQVLMALQHRIQSLNGNQEVKLVLTGARPGLSDQPPMKPLTLIEGPHDPELERAMLRPEVITDSDEEAEQSSDEEALETEFLNSPRFFSPHLRQRRPGQPTDEELLGFDSAPEI